MEAVEQELKAVREWDGGGRFTGITRVHTPRRVIEQRGTVSAGYMVVRESAEHFYRGCADSPPAVR
jgi:isocitrate lyase